MLQLKISWKLACRFALGKCLRILLHKTVNLLIHQVCEFLLLFSVALTVQFYFAYCMPKVGPIYHNREHFVCLPWAARRGEFGYWEEAEICPTRQIWQIRILQQIGDLSLTLQFLEFWVLVIASDTYFCLPGMVAFANPDSSILETVLMVKIAVCEEWLP